MVKVLAFTYVFAGWFGAVPVGVISTHGEAGLVEAGGPPFKPGGLAQGGGGFVARCSP